MEDMIVKTTEGHDHVTDLEDVLQLVKKYNMLLSFAKCSFVVQAEKFLGYMLTKRGIEANSYKLQVVIDMRSPTTSKKCNNL